MTYGNCNQLCWTKMAFTKLADYDRSFARDLDLDCSWKVVIRPKGKGGSSFVGVPEQCHSYFVSFTRLNGLSGKYDIRPEKQWRVPYFYPFVLMSLAQENRKFRPLKPFTMGFFFNWKGTTQQLNRMNGLFLLLLVQNNDSSRVDPYPLNFLQHANWISRVSIS